LALQICIVAITAKVSNVLTNFF